MSTSLVDKAALLAHLEAARTISDTAFNGFADYIRTLPDAAPVPVPVPTPTPTPTPVPTDVLGALGSDGSVAAPAGGAKPFPTLFAPYPRRPSWKVAGVDYGVGATGTLKDWWSATGPGVSVDRTLGRLRIDGASGTTLRDLDLARHGGCQLLIVGARNTTLQNCNIVNGATSDKLWTAGLIQGDGNSPGLALLGCTIIGGAPPLGARGSSLIFWVGGGDMVFEYNLLRDSPQHAWELSGLNMSLRRRFNVISNIGNSGPDPLNHPNTLQFGGGSWVAGPNTCVNEFNTIVQPKGGKASGECEQFYMNGVATVIPRPSLRNSVIICAGGPDPNVAAHGGRLTSSTPTAARPMARSSTTGSTAPGPTASPTRATSPASPSRATWI